MCVYPMTALVTDQAGRIAKVIYKDEKLKGNGTAGLFVGQSEKDLHMRTNYCLPDPFLSLRSGKGL